MEIEGKGISHCISANLDVFCFTTAKNKHLRVISLLIQLLKAQSKENVLIIPDLEENEQISSLFLSEVQPNII